MERANTKTKNNKAPDPLVMAQKINVYSQLIGRANLVSRLGMQYGTDRDLYEALGYKTTLLYEDFMARYERQDIAKAIIDRPVKATWQGSLLVVENPKLEQSALEKDWKTLSRDLRLKSNFARLDKLASIGEYGVLLLGLDDVSSRASFTAPVKKGKRKLLYIKPFGQDKAKIKNFVAKTNDPRYGLPEYYNITIQVTDENRTEDVVVHHSRVIHVTGETLESEVRGIPVLQAVFNRLMDLEKIVGGDAEMFWRGARPGYQGKVDENYQLTPEMEADLKDQIDEFEHNLRRILVNEGIDLQALQQQIADPINHVDVQIQMISAVTGIPKRILTGTERGELASTQDKGEYLSFVTSRREEHAEPRVVEPFVDRCIEYGILPAPADEYDIVWEDLFVLNEQEQTDVGHKRATAVREYTQNPFAESIISPEMFVKHMLGLKPHEVEEVLEALEQLPEMELPIAPQEQEIMSEEEMAIKANDDSK
jgi:hypothetical protein